jgi:hypothetical protein
MATIRKAWMWKGAVALALLSTLTPALSAPSSSDAAKRLKPRVVSLNAPGILGSFTPASNPRMASMLAQSGATSGGFRFTPSVAPGARRAVTVAVRARGAGPAQVHTGSRPTAIAMAQANAGQSSLANAYNLGAAIGWQRFVVSGDLANVDTGPLFGERKAADIGLSYAGKRWSTTVQLSADRSGVSNRFLGRDESVALDVGGSYRIATNIDVTGGVRYKMQRDRLDSTVDNRRDSQSVYVGTAFRF